ncbi:MAG TPA: tail fiber protein [Solirubrobacterales bacterium]|nr:tail fiber protein [Solirubrobacterales bacterium]
MAGEPFLGELRLWSCDYAPKGWAECNGQVLQVRQNQSLFSLLGGMYGGDGKTTFALPDLRSRFPFGYDPRYPQGYKMGKEFHTLVEAEIPAHSHPIGASRRPGSQPQPALLASTENTYRNADRLTPIHPETLLKGGGGQAHENRQPYTTLTWCIAIQGIFPDRT